MSNAAKTVAPEFLRAVAASAARAVAVRASRPSAMQLLETLWRIDPEGGWHVHGPPRADLVVHDRVGMRDHVAPTLEGALRSALASVVGTGGAS